MRMDISWIRGSNALTLLRNRLSTRLVEHPQKLTRSSCAVFLPICHRKGSLSLLYTRRTDTLNSHTGQVSFPGGRCDEGETVRETSVREMGEEIGVQPHSVWGSLPRPIISLKLENVYGCVGYLGHYEDNHFTLSDVEVSHIFTIPLEDLVNSRAEKVYDNQTTTRQRRVISQRIASNDLPGEKNRQEVLSALDKINQYKMPVFPTPLEQDPEIWGLTAILTDQLLLAAFKKDGYKRHDFTVT